MSNRNH